MSNYETPAIIELGSVADFTRGDDFAVGSTAFSWAHILGVTPAADSDWRDGPGSTRLRRAVRVSSEPVTDVVAVVTWSRP